MKRMLINATQKEELRIALVDGQKLCDLNIESLYYKKKKSNIYKGKVLKLEPSLEAAFIDYGVNRHGFLPLREVSKEYFPSNNFEKNDKKFHIQEVLKEGQELMVQVSKEERGNKGASLTTFLSLAGSYLVLMPNSPNSGGISRRIEGNDRDNMKKVLSSLQLPEGMSIIIRTSGLGKSIETLKQDLNFRLKNWYAIKQASSKYSAPFLIYQEGNALLRAFRDYLKPDIKEIIIDNIDIIKEVKNHIILLGRFDFLNKIKIYNGDIPLFSHYQIEYQIESAFNREVRLPSGGSIYIDNTEALTAIDINSSKSTSGCDIEETAFNTNLEAVSEIARQIRLRDLGGLIVIDFIDMSLLKNQREIENIFRELVKQDKARIRIGRISCFGLLELSRQRLSKSLGETSHIICPRCNGQGRIRDIESLSLSILRLIEEEAFKDNTHEVYAIVPIIIASYLFNKKRDSINLIEQRAKGVNTKIIPSNNMQTPNYLVKRIRKGEINNFFDKLNHSDINLINNSYKIKKINKNFYHSEIPLTNINTNYNFNKISIIRKVILKIDIFFRLINNFVLNIYRYFKKVIFNLSINKNKCYKKMIREKDKISKYDKNKYKKLYFMKNKKHYSYFNTRNSKKNLKIYFSKKNLINKEK